ncbi:hypothetical protein ILYODFUR_018324 [Ilyodon furcidens]|uniref:Uncharacterized protein n=1 Tax=Ilyodon furcidens TaxID=33524 RepID=A0ABV0UT87_9TELE
MFFKIHKWDEFKADAGEASSNSQTQRLLFSFQPFLSSSSSIPVEADEVLRSRSENDFHKLRLTSMIPILYELERQKYTVICEVQTRSSWLTTQQIKIPNNSSTTDPHPRGIEKEESLMHSRSKEESEKEEVQTIAHKDTSRGAAAVCQLPPCTKPSTI